MKINHSLIRLAIKAGISETFGTRVYYPKEGTGHSRDYTRFVLLSYQRSGSTMLVSALRQHPNIQTFGEVFNPGSVMLHTPGYDNHAYYLRQLRDTKPRTFLDRFIFRGFDPTIQAVGLKLFPSQAQDPLFEQALAELIQDPKIKLIHLKRDNLLAVYLSYRRATASGVWAVDQGATDNAPLVLEPEQCEQAFREMRIGEAYFESILRSRPQLSLSYETLSSDLEPRLTSVQEFLGVDVKAIAPTLRKQRHGSLRDNIQNFDQLREYFSGTEWESFFATDMGGT